MDKVIEDFFKRYVFGWMYSDAGICEKHGANFGGVALICAYIDFMGKLYLGIGGDGQIKERFVKFTNDFFGEKYRPFSEFIYSDYRCGLLHQFFPRRGAGVMSGEENRKYHLAIDKENGLIPINITVFLEDFKKAVDSYYKKLMGDEQLKNNFNTVYQSMKDTVSENFKDLLTEINSQTFAVSRVTGVVSSTIASGASLMSSVGVGVRLSDPDSIMSRMPLQQPINVKENKEAIVQYLWFVGPSGSGKTTAVINCSKDNGHIIRERLSIKDLDVVLCEESLDRDDDNILPHIKEKYCNFSNSTAVFIDAQWPDVMTEKCDTINKLAAEIPWAVHRVIWLNCSPEIAVRHIKERAEKEWEHNYEINGAKDHHKNMVNYIRQLNRDRFKLDVLDSSDYDYKNSDWASVEKYCE